MQSKNLSRITIDIPHEQHKKLKSIAALEGKSMREVIIESIEIRLRSKKTADSPDEARIKDIIQDVLKKYAPALEKLAKSITRSI